MENKIKRIGTREDVYKGLAIHTAGGLKKEDIIEKKIGSKILYISKKLSDKMKVNINIIRTNNPNFFKRIQKKTIVNKENNINNNLESSTNTNTNTHNTNISRKKNNCRTQKLAFKVKDNSVKTIFYPELKGFDLRELKDELIREEAEEDIGIKLPPNNEFKIEELPDININDLI
jgi:hypothetical protein